jgi:uncharacterized damage-inducible protein DinB
MTTPVVSPESLLSEYADGPARLEAALTGLSDSELDLSLGEHAWTIRQIVHHIADGDDLWKTCIKAALGNSDGLFTLQWYWDRPQMEWAEGWSYASRSVESSLTLLDANRHHIVELLEHVPDALERSIRLQPPHDTEVRITVKDVIEMQVRHMTGHTQDIQAIRLAHGV